MNLNKAIEILREMLHQIPPLLGPEDKDAIRLGSEALEYIKHSRVFRGYSVNRQLPSETKE